MGDLRGSKCFDCGAMVDRGDHDCPVRAIDDLVDRFATALREKLQAAEAKYDHNGAWRRDDWRDDLVAHLLRHVDKGDPRDVAAYCAFAWHHGWTVKPPIPIATKQTPSEGKSNADV